MRVAQVRGTRGLDGTLRLEILSDYPEDRFVLGKTLHVEGSDRELTLTEWSPASPGAFARFAEVPDRGTAQALVGSYLSLPLAADTGEPGRVYWDDVIGVQVTDTAGGVIGTVIDCYRAGGAEVYVLRTPDGGELDLPAVASIIVTFKPREGVIVADLTGSDLVPRPPKRAKPTRPASSVRTP
ncbi:MAG: ribosome maturation factor RimM [Candidatus Limnocylindrus sp.]